MPTLQWNAYSAAVNYLTTELNSLANGGWALSGLINNSVNLRVYSDIDVVLSAAVTAGSGNPTLDLYLIPAPDGTNSANPPGGTAGAVPVTYFVGAIAANASASFTRGTLRGIILPPGYFRIALQNNLGAALPATGNTAKGYEYTEQSV